LNQNKEDIEITGVAQIEKLVEELEMVFGQSQSSDQVTRIHKLYSSIS
jgi:hypothetical protein